MEANELINENSPYLRQHAYNPVNWLPWNERSIEIAKKENKLIILSIGYSACHWCHVMEKESFEDLPTAEIMNEFFISIKVDREERPDIDQLYMSAVQLMTGHGGWPLNCILLPDGRPIYGGTYFPNLQWRNILMNISSLYKNDRKKAENYASELTNGILKSELIQLKMESGILEPRILEEMVKEWKNYFDNQLGGSDKAPKFPMPSNYTFLLRYAFLFHDKNIKQHVYLTLNKMARGGIYDQLEGGFARYSVDAHWKVPHFEKMLYDNAQLMSLYAEAFQESKNEFYLKIVHEIFEFIEQELSNKNGAWFSALDADTENEEGKFYVWTKEEIREILDENEFRIAEKYFCLDERAYWENENYILLQSDSLPEISMHLGLNPAELNKEIEKIKFKLKEHRDNRIRPGLDDKIITSWNALMVKACIDAYKASLDEKFLKRAERSFDFFKSTLVKEDGSIFHTCKNKNPYINGFLDDYAFTITAFTELYQFNGNEDILNLAKKCTDYCISNFKDTHSDFFYYTSDIDPPLIARKIDLNDNVIPSSNSQMAIALQKIGLFFDDEKYTSLSVNMLQKISSEIKNYPPAYGNWAMAILNYIKPGAEIVLVGKSVEDFLQVTLNFYLPNCIFVKSDKESTLPLLLNRFSDGENKAFVCKQKTCFAPSHNNIEFEKQVAQLFT